MRGTLERFINLVSLIDLVHPPLYTFFMPPKGEPKNPMTEINLGDTMTTPEKINDALTPLESLSGIPFQNACSELFGDNYYSLKEEGKAIRSLIIAEARRRGYSESIDPRVVRNVVEKYSPSIPPLDIKELEKDFEEQRRTNPDFEVASTHPDDVPPEGLSSQIPLLPIKREDE